MALWISLAAAAGLAVVHLVAGKLRFLEVIPRSRWLSFASGISVAYVFLHLLPALEEAQHELARWLGPELAFTRHHVYLLALVGLTVFYGLERAAEESRRRRREAVGEDRSSERVFWLHAVFFGVYNALIGHLLVEKAEEPAAAAVFFVAMALHFVVNDYGLRQHHKEVYASRGRWLLAAGVFVGWAAGATLHVSAWMPAVPLALIAGGVVLNVLKEELPRERQSRFWAFALGVAAYSALLLSM